MVFSMEQVTLRGTGPLLQCDCGTLASQPEETPPGEISVQAAGCVFAPASGRALLLLEGANSPQGTLKGVKWTGQGALVLPESPIAAWQRADGAEQTLDESAVSMAGLVRSAVSFAGDAKDVPAGSKAVRWQAPLQSADPPGVDTDALPLPPKNPVKPARN
jgi:hypothetical protein